MTYEGRPADYDPETACPKTRKKLLGPGTMIHLLCDLATGHDGEKHRLTASGLVIYWEEGADDVWPVTKP